MKFEDYMIQTGELPLENIPADGGFTSIFRTIGCIGDSLSSGEYEAHDLNGNNVYVDMFDYSWGQYMARKIGSKVYNFSRGGMTAIEYWKTFGDSIDAWNPDKKCQAYIIALSCNDLFGMRQPVGDVDTDVNDEDPEKNADTFIGWYCRVLSRMQKIAPDAKFFLMTEPKDEDDDEFHTTTKLACVNALYKVAAHYPNCYVLDFNRYAPTYTHEAHHLLWLNGHLNPMGYKVTADMVCAYIDYIIRKNPRDFLYTGFAHTEYMKNLKIEG